MAKDKVRTRRCAIYTRKSSEEGLDQDFNSLDAQREACAAYVQSQVGEGWKLLPTLYDDGGFSGGSMDRPALEQLLADIRARKIDTVVVTGVTTENCCHATARDALFNGYRVAFISDATGTFDYPDIGYGAIPAAEVHRVSLGILGVSTAHVMSTDEFIDKSSATGAALQAAE